MSDKRASNPEREMAAKLPYNSPALRLYGSVRNLTGGSGGFMGDGGGSMTRGGSMF